MYPIHFNWQSGDAEQPVKKPELDRKISFNESAEVIRVAKDDSKERPETIDEGDDDSDDGEGDVSTEL